MTERGAAAGIIVVSSAGVTLLMPPPAENARQRKPNGVRDELIRNHGLRCRSKISCH